MNAPSITLTAPLAGHDIRLFEAAEGGFRYHLADALLALGLATPAGRRLINSIRRAHIKPLSGDPETETVDQRGMNALALNSRQVGGLAYHAFLLGLPRRAGRPV